MTDARGKDIAVKPESRTAVFIWSHSIKHHFVSFWSARYFSVVYTGFGEGGSLLLTLLVLKRIPFEFITHQPKYYVIIKESCC